LTVYLPVYSMTSTVHTGTRFTVLVLCSDEFAAHSCPLLFLSAEASCETCIQIVLLLSFIALQQNGKKILHVFTWSYGSRRFAACEASIERS